METALFSEMLKDERCGLLFLAGYDKATAGGRGRLTVHAARGNLSNTHEGHISRAVAEIHPSIDVQFVHHEFKTLFKPRCLEDFFARFRHEEIVSDPTGAFARAQKLLALTASFRTEFGKWLDNVFWQFTTGTLHLMIVKSEAVPLSSVKRSIENAAWRLLDQDIFSELDGVVQNIVTSTSLPSGYCTPVDNQSVGRPSRTQYVLGMLAKASALAGLVGLGSATLANAHQGPGPLENAVMPGISALSGLTTLGENALGQRNMFQSRGGLRLYFGNSDPQLMADCGMGDFLDGSCSVFRMFNGNEGNPVGSNNRSGNRARSSYGG